MPKIERERSKGKNKPGGQTNGGLSFESRPVAAPIPAKQPESQEPIKKPNEYIVMTVRRSEFGYPQDFMFLRYSPGIPFEDLLSLAQATSGDQLREIISEGVIDIWDNIPIERKRQIPDIVSLAGFEPSDIINRGKRRLAQKAAQEQGLQSPQF